MTNGDKTLDSCAQFLAVAEHRIILTRAKSVGHHLRKADRQSVCARACQDRISGGHAGVGVISSRAVPLSAPSLVTAEFRKFFRLGRAMRVTLSTGEGGVVYLFVEYGYEVSEEDSEKLPLTDKLLRAVLPEAQVVCVGSLCLL